MPTEDNKSLKIKIFILSVCWKPRYNVVSGVH